MGPMYGFMWRHIGEEYHGCEKSYKGFDQLNDLINNIKNDPYSRRHLLTTYCPLYNEQGCLIPCHGIATQFYVEIKDNKKYLSCFVFNRSQDTFLGMPFNIASYSILTYIIAKLVDMLPCKLIFSSGDTHIYNNHIDQVNIQLKRNVLPFPILEIDDFKSIDDLNLEKFKVIGYLYNPSIKAKMAI
jgi:thymidylate synthase